MQSYEELNTCLVCDSDNLKKNIFDLGLTPLANDFISIEDYNNGQRNINYPLALNQCNDCQHIQLSISVDKHKLFDNYSYVSGTSKTFVKHFEEYAKSIYQNEVFGHAPNDIILDVGSNDGTFVAEIKKYYESMGRKKVFAYGVDPAKNLYEIAKNKNVETICGYFEEEETLKEIETKILLLPYRRDQEFGMIEILTCNNAFAHSPKINEIIQGVKKLLRKDGTFIIEVQYIMDVLDNNLFDNIYHEHIHFYSLKALEKLFNKHNMRVYGCEFINTHGGSLRVFIERMEGEHEKNLKSLNKERWNYLQQNKLKCYEREEKLQEKLHDFKSNLEKIKNKLIDKLQDIYTYGGSIIAYGAPAKATTLFYYFNIDNNKYHRDDAYFPYTIDDNKLKQNTVSPGKYIPIKSINWLEQDIKNENSPEYILILAWNFKNEIIKKCKEIGYKGKFITPLPNFEIND
jgi:SAM-dependent methyltransferase